MILARKNIKIIFKYVLAPLLGVWLFYSLYKQIRDQPNFANPFISSKKLLSVHRHGSSGSVIALVFVNWGIEAKKWQVLLKTLQPFSFITAYKSVLSGVTLSLNTPNRMGEYGGRILYVQEGNRIKAISLSIAGSISQLIITLFLGCCGLAYTSFLINDSNTGSSSNGTSCFLVEDFIVFIFLCNCDCCFILFPDYHG